VKNTALFLSNTLLILILAGSCQLKEFKEKVVPQSPTSGTVDYPLLYPTSPEFDGTLRFEKLADGTIKSNLKLTGLKSGRRYFGKITSSNAADFSGGKSIADLGEIKAENGVLESWIHEDYVNKPIFFDSLVNADARIVVEEIDPLTGIKVEVIRGDIGSNLLLEGNKIYDFESIGANQITGNIEFRTRKNGNTFVTTKIQGISNESNVELSLFFGDASIDKFTRGDRREKALNNYSGNQKVVYSDLGKLIPSLSSLDSLKGFIGIKANKQEGDLFTNFLGFANLGGNIKTGRNLSYSIFDDSDTLRGKLIFEEVGVSFPVVVMNFEPIKISKIKNYFLYFIKGNSFEKENVSFTSFKINDSSSLKIKNPLLENLKTKTLDEIKNWNASLLIAEADFNSKLPKTDIGQQNEILNSDSLVVTLSSPPFDGKIVFKQRKSGESICKVTLNQGYNGTTNLITIRQGPKPSTLADTTARLVEISWDGNIGKVLEKQNLKNNAGNPILWSELKTYSTSNAYVEYGYLGDYYLPFIRSNF
jgi:hypothetical protein